MWYVTRARCFPQHRSWWRNGITSKTLRDRDAGTVIGQMVQGKVIKAPNFNVARRREVPDDGFDGVVIVTAFQSFFVKFWQTLEPQPDSLFALSPQ